MATYPTSLLNAFTRKVKPVAAIIDADATEAALRQAVREVSVHLPDLRTYDHVGNGTYRVAISATLRAALLAIGGMPLERLISIENPVDLTPVREWEDEDWDISPRSRLPLYFVLKGRPPVCCQAFSPFTM